MDKHGCFEQLSKKEVSVSWTTLPQSMVLLYAEGSFCPRAKDSAEICEQVEILIQWKVGWPALANKSTRCPIKFEYLTKRILSHVIFGTYLY